MNSKLAARLIIDLAMTIFILFALAYHITGDVAHEWIGISVAVLFIVHNALNWRWYKNIFKGKYKFRRSVNTAVNFILLITMTTLIISGILMSRIIFTFLNLPGGMEMRQIHTTAAYWGLIIIAIHIGMHWEMIINAFNKMIKIKGDKSPCKNIIRKITARFIALIIIVFGVWSSFDRDMFSKLFLGFSFDYWNEERPATFFFVVMLSIMGIYVFITHFILKLSERKRQKE
jgi:cytochrome b561